MKTTFWGPFLFGAGIMALLDGIILHQILQWHSAYMHTTRPGQIYSDGVFHLFAVAIVLISGVLLWKDRSAARADSGKLFWGCFLLGAGAFNLLEGIIDHHLLGIHHVREGVPNQQIYDFGFDAVSIILLIIGWLLYKRRRAVI